MAKEEIKNLEVASRGCMDPGGALNSYYCSVPGHKTKFLCSFTIMHYAIRMNTPFVLLLDNISLYLIYVFINCYM